MDLLNDHLFYFRKTNYINHPKLFIFDFVDESETKQFRWKLEGLSNESKLGFLTKVRDSYKKFMDVPMPETFVCSIEISLTPHLSNLLFSRCRKWFNNLHGQNISICVFSLFNVSL